jgi:hypothetical protein
MSIAGHNIIAKVSVRDAFLSSNGFSRPGYIISVDPNYAIILSASRSFWPTKRK